MPIRRRSRSFWWNTGAGPCCWSSALSRKSCPGAAASIRQHGPGFAIGVALGLSKNDGVMVLAAVVGFLVMTTTISVMAIHVFGLDPDNPRMMRDVVGIRTMDTGVFGGIIIGGIAAGLFNRYYRIELPLSRICGQAICADCHGVGCHRARCFSLASSGRTCKAASTSSPTGRPTAIRPSPRQFTAWSNACCCRSVCTIWNAVLLRNRQLYQCGGQDRPRRYQPFCGRSDRRHPQRRLLAQDVGLACGGDCHVALRQAGKPDKKPAV